MIKCDDRGVVEIRGRKFELMAELTVIIREMKDTRVITDDDLQRCIEQASKTDEELSAEISAQLDDVIKEIIGSILQCVVLLSGAVAEQVDAYKVRAV